MFVFDSNGTRPPFRVPYPRDSEDSKTIAIMEFKKINGGFSVTFSWERLAWQAAYVTLAVTLFVEVLYYEPSTM